MNKRKKQLKSIDKLLDVMDKLREKCPWDKKQTIQSLRSLTIEETYELSDAILENDTNSIKDELGDILIHIIFYSKIASETNKFDLSDVTNSVTERLIFRHPHVFGNLKIKNIEDVKRNWESLKIMNGSQSVLSGIPKCLPSINKAERILDKAAAVGFDWKNNEDIIKKIKEESNEFLLELSYQNKKNMEEEFGDLFFSLINYARRLKIDSDKALEKANKKFMKRFTYMEGKLNIEKKKINSLSLTEMNRLWDTAKKNT
ncbi:MAG: nucleoside triphosphate pyrophosphohydrolase [Flavobacteriaceae bacterium]|nr:nucleoside triphosphate pyrophosphohydrolase [Flavobacteriaceae bacterium]|tara:strand:+ start:5122 stop:5898 length:777 start_codon:yes stop_codon:yes gene_type:complete